jgi:hypothetical protein
VTVADAVTAYDKEVVDRGAKEVQLTRELALSIRDWSNILESPIVKFGDSLVQERPTERGEGLESQ